MRAMFKRHMGTVYSVTFSPDGRFLVSGSEDCSVGIWNIRDGSSKKLLETGHVAYVVFSPDGKYIAAGDLSFLLYIWDSRTHNLIAKWKGHNTFVWCVKFTPDGKGLMSGSSDGAVKYWDVSSLGPHEVISGSEVATRGDSFPLIRNFPGHTVRCFSFNCEWLTKFTYTGAHSLYCVLSWQRSMGYHRFRRQERARMGCPNWRLAVDGRA